MKRRFGAVLSVVGSLGITSADIPGQRSEAERLLRALAPDAVYIEEMHRLVRQLGAEDFGDREDATRMLRALPSLPAEVVARGKESGDPEVIVRLGKLVAEEKGGQREEIFTKSLRLIFETEEKGLLAPLANASSSSIICRDLHLLERVAGITAGPQDVEVVQGCRSAPARSA